MKCLFQTITVTIKSGFERYTKKKKILAKIIFFGLRSGNLKIKYFIRKVWER